MKYLFTLTIIVLFTQLGYSQTIDPGLKNCLEGNYTWTDNRGNYHHIKLSPSLTIEYSGYIYEGGSKNAIGNKPFVMYGKWGANENTVNILTGTFKNAEKYKDDKESPEYYAWHYQNSGYKGAYNLDEGTIIFMGNKYTRDEGPCSQMKLKENEGSANTYQDPNAVIKSASIDLMNMWASETDDVRIKQISKNLNDTRDWIDAFQKIDPDNAQGFDKIEDFAMIGGAIAPFIFKSQINREEELTKERSEKNDLRNQDARIKEFEKKILTDVLVVKQHILKEIAKGNKKKSNEYFQVYLTLLSTPIATYDANELIYQFYSDVNTSQSWTQNMKLYPFDIYMESELAKYQLNTTIGNIYYGGRQFSAKKLLDLLLYQLTLEKVNDTEILRLLDSYKLYSEGSEKFDYQPFLFALNYANEANNTQLFEAIWSIINVAYQTGGNTVTEVKVSEKVSDQKNHLKSQDYLTRQGKLSTKGKTGIVKSMSYSILKRRYDFIKGNPVDENYSALNVIYTFSSYKTAAPSMMAILFSNQLEQAYFLQLMLENTYNDIELGIKTEDKKTFLSNYKSGIKTHKLYAKLTNGEKEKKKSNYFRPVYLDQSTVTYISSLEFIKHAKPMATAERFYQANNSVYKNASFDQDARNVMSRPLYYNAWAHYFRTGSRDMITTFASKNTNNPYVQLEWLISYGETL